MLNLTTKIVMLTFKIENLFHIGDAEMGNRLNRVVRGCLEADINPVECRYTFSKYIFIHIIISNL